MFIKSLSDLISDEYIMLITAAFFRIQVPLNMHKLKRYASAYRFIKVFICLCS